LPHIKISFFISSKKAKYQQNIKDYELFSKISVEILKANVLDRNDTKRLITEIDESKTLGPENKLELEMSTGSLFLTKPPNLKEQANLEDQQTDILETSKIILRNEITLFKDKTTELIYKRFKNSMNPLKKNSISDVVYEEVKTHKKY
jgi:hypothetical protein